MKNTYACVSLSLLPSGDSVFLVCKRGDLLLVEKDEKYSLDENLIKATNQRTGTIGVTYKDTVQFLPTLSRPSEEMLVEFPLHVTLFSYLLFAQEEKGRNICCL